MIERLDHHEERRYDYLLSNLAYLNDREREEFHYLQAKKEGQLGSESSAQAFQESQEFSSPPLEKEQGKNLPHTDLPLYQKESLSRRKKNRSPLAVTDQKLARSPKAKSKSSKGGCRRLFKIVLLLFLGLLASMIFFFVKGMNAVKSEKTNYKPAMVEVFNGADSPNGTNILILGSDQRVSQGSTEARTDTIMVMNTGNKDGKIKLASFMRDTLVNIEGYSQDTAAYDLKLNTAFTLGEQDSNQGAEYVRQVLKNMYDIDIKYYAMIDFESFAVAIDTLFPKGVEIDAQFSTVDGQEVASIEAPNDVGFGDQSTPYQTIYVGKQRMNGQTLLNYARFRGDDLGDSGRVQRQQQVMEAVIGQIKDPTKLFTGSEAIGKIFALTSTNISYPFLLTNGIGALTSGQQGIEHISIPEHGDWVDDYDMYGGMGLWVDFEAYKEKLAELGFR